MANIQQISSQIVKPPQMFGAEEMQYMCRICANCDVSINAFSELGKLLKLEEKIRTCFRLEMNEAGPHPNNVCMNCLGKVNICYEVSLQVTSTQEKIATALSRTTLHSMVNGANPSRASPGSKYSPKIESVQSLMPNAFMFQESNNVPTNPAPVEPPKPVPPSPGVKRSASPETPSKKERKTVCSTCGEWFFKSELAAHTKQVHQSIKLVFGCVNCSANFTTQEELTKHSEKCS